MDGKAVIQALKQGVLITTREFASHYEMNYINIQFAIKDGRIKEDEYIKKAQTLLIDRTAVERIWGEPKHPWPDHTDQSNADHSPL